MPLLVLSDVHADAAALDRVLADAAGRWDRLALLGDLVGYGDAPREAVQRLRRLGPVAAVRGNHEAMLARLVAGERPNATRDVVATLEAHAEALDAGDLDWLAHLPARATLGGLGLVHGDPDPERPFGYLLGVPAARRAAAHADRPWTLFGHTHVPGGFVRRDGRWRPLAARGPATTVRLPQGDSAFLSPGSVAAARDGGPGACYLILDEATGVGEIRRLGAA